MPVDHLNGSKNKRLKFVDFHFREVFQKAGYVTYPGMFKGK